MFEFIFSWTMLWWLLLLIYIPSCIGLIVVVLMQKGKGVGFAGAFGMGGSEAVFGPRTARSLPQKMTYTAGGIFITIALLLSVVTNKVGRGVAPGVVDEDEAAIAESTALDNFFADEIPEGDPLLEDFPEEATEPTDPGIATPVVEPLDEALEDDFPEVPVSPLEEPVEPTEEDADSTDALTDELPTDLELEAPSFGDVDVEIVPGEAQEDDADGDEESAE